MGDSRPALVLGKDKVLPKHTSGKILSLSNVLHVKDICYNLVFVSILVKVGVRVSFEGDKVILSKNGVLVGKGNYCNGLFILNVLNVIMNESVSSFAYIVDSLDLWHARLGHINFAYIKRMKRFGLLSDFSNSDFEKCDVCVEVKSIKKTCKYVERETKLLSLIHIDMDILSKL